MKALADRKALIPAETLDGDLRLQLPGKATAYE
jgi:hypothetical protein